MTSSAVARVERAISKGDQKRALAEAERGLAQGDRHPLLLRIVARALTEKGRFTEAGELLNQALAIAPADVDALCGLGILLLREDRADEAINVFASALRLTPMHFDSWLGLAHALEAEQRAESSLQAYERAARLKPLEPAPLAGMAELHWQAGRSEQASKAAEEALVIDRFNPLANLVQARALLLNRSSEEAWRRADALLIRGGLNVFERSSALKTHADALDRLDRIPEAVRSYERMNQVAVDAHQARFGPGGRVENHLEFMARLRRGYETYTDDWRISAAEANAVSRHIFVLGYHRSGNTLAAAVLGSLPEVRVLEERPTLNEADLAFLREPEGLACLAHLSEEEILRQRSFYWDQVRREVPDPNGGVFVDMSPLNSIKLPMIAKLFPEARIVMCERDPRDVVLSCWRQNFAINAATYQMTDLVKAAQHFDMTMSLAQATLPMIDNQVHQLRYDDYVGDFEEGSRNLVGAMGLEWSDAALNFSESAKTRELRTASASQIRGGLFDGRAQWKRYEDYLQPIASILSPWLGRGLTPDTNP